MAAGLFYVYTEPGSVDEDRVVASALRRERRVFGRRNAIGA
jgi:hypothetical protein